MRFSRKVAGLVVSDPSNCLGGHDAADRGRIAYFIDQIRIHQRPPAEPTGGPVTIVHRHRALFIPEKTSIATLSPLSRGEPRCFSPGHFIRLHTPTLVVQRFVFIALSYKTAMIKVQIPSEEWGKTGHHGNAGHGTKSYFLIIL